MLGRAKPFGAGQTRVSLRKVQIEWNDTAGVIDISQNWTDHLAALDAHVGLNTANKAAVTHMREQLLKTADPAFGDALYRQDKLNGMELANFATIRKMVQRDVDGAAPIKTPLIDI